MLQWMGGSRRKVTTSRKSVQKRQRQYFEQKKRQQQYQEQTERLESNDDRIDISATDHKEHRSLDVISLLTLSTIAQECKSACPCRRKDKGINAPEMGFDITNHSPVILSDVVVPAKSVESKETRRKDQGINAPKMGFDITNHLPVILSDVVVPAKSVESKETRILSCFQVNTASPNNISSSSHDSQKNVVGGANSKPDLCNTTAEQQLSILDLLCDDGMHGNVEEDIAHEPHVAFSVEGLGKVGTETPVHSPQRPNRNFSYGFSSSPKAARRLKLSNKCNSLLDDFEFEMDAEMQDIDIPIDRNPLEFTSDVMDSLSSPKQRSFTVREARQHDCYSHEKNSYIGHHNEDERDDRASFQYQSFFEEREPNISRKTWQSQNNNSAADDLIYRDNNMPDFSFDGPCTHVRNTGKVTDQLDILGSTFSFSKHETSEYDYDFLNSHRARFHIDEAADRHPTKEQKFDLKHVISIPDRFSFMTEDGMDNSSLQSEESCSSSAVRYQGTDTSTSNSIPRQGSGFIGSCDKYGVRKALANDSKDDVQHKSVALGIGKGSSMFDSPGLKSLHRSSSYSRENLETGDIWFFEEGHATVDINPGSSTFNKNSGAKHTHFDSNFWGEDPFSMFPIPKSQIGTDPLGDRFNPEPVAYSPSKCFTSKKIPPHDSSPISKPDFPPDSELRNGPQCSTYNASFQSEMPSPDLSAHESVSKDVEHKVNLDPSNFCETFELGEEINARNEGLVSGEKEAVEASHSKNNESVARETKDADLQQKESVNKTLLLEPVEETSPSVDITDKSGSIKDEEDHQNDKIPLRQNRRKGNVQDVFRKGKMGGKQKSDYVDPSCQGSMLQSYIFQFFCVQKRLKY